MKNNKGFTLIEMLVVVGIIALMAAVMMPTISSYFQVSLNSATRDLATTIKEAYNSSVVTGKVYRLVYDLKENTYWVEFGPAEVLLDTKESKEKEERRKKFSKSVTKKPEFKMDTTISRKKAILPRGVVFEDLVTEQSKEPITEGTAYTHFFPHGLTEQTVIHLQDQSKHHASLVITALVGDTNVYDRYVTAKEIFETR
jgi:type II secretion system protein H